VLEGQVSVCYFPLTILVSYSQFEDSSANQKQARARATNHIISLAVSPGRHQSGHCLALCALAGVYTGFGRSFVDYWSISWRILQLILPTHVLNIHAC
jgi:hypothetical protein